MIRPLTSIGEFSGCVELQRTVFQWAEADVTPVRMFVLMRETGGLVLGAYRDGGLVGFVSCTPGVRNGDWYWQSHTMCVLPRCQNLGIGTALKLAQREHAIERGASAIEWAFDPLVPKNAHLNIAKLGAWVRRYSVNHYGASTSPLTAGLDTDRLIAEWQLTPARRRLGVAARRLAIPADAHELARADQDAARAIQLSVRAGFLRNLADGFVVVACERRQDGLEYLFREEL